MALGPSRKKDNIYRKEQNIISNITQGYVKACYVNTNKQFLAAKKGLLTIYTGMIDRMIQRK
jgi:hypothetical protein